MAKLKVQAEEKKKPNSLETYAIALKYDYRLTESQFKFEELRNANKLSELGKIEYAGLLIKTKNYKKAIEVLAENSTSKKGKYLKKIAKRLIDQNCIEYKSGTENQSSYCYTFNAELSVNPVQPDLIYTWDFDSRNKKEGVRVDYCFDVSGTHIIKLGSYDSKNQITNADSTFTLTIVPPLDFESMKSNNIINKPISFNYEEELNADQDILWHFGNGIFKVGKQVEYFFNRPGNYYIEYYIIEPNMQETSLKCNACQLFINQNKAEQKANQ